MTSQHISKNQLDALKKLGLPEVKENNQWLVLHVKGDGERAPQSWNARIYTNSAGNMKVVTTDMAIFAALLGGQKQDQLIVPPGKSEASRVISIDDSGWGFPLLGTLVGLHDSLDDSIHIGEVPVKFYQPPLFERKDYLFQAANVVTKLIGELKLENADCFRPQTVNVLFKVCTGYVNTGIVKDLRERGFRVETCKIEEPLQSALEAAHKKYILENAKTDLYYDPKELSQKQIPQKFNEVVGWIKANNAWNIAKTGWKFFQQQDTAPPLP